MSQAAGYSPSFKRPAEVLRLRRKRVRSDAGPGLQVGSDSPGLSSPSPVGVRPFSPGPLLSPGRRSGGQMKRRNPFANMEDRLSPRKRLRVHNDRDAARTGDVSPEVSGGPGSLADRLTCQDGFSDPQNSDGKTQDCPTTPEDYSLFEEKEEDVQSPLLKSPQAIAPLSIAPPLCTAYPTDWSLKTRLLFTSSLSLSWAEKPKAQEEAQGLSRHLRASFCSLPPHSPQDPQSSSERRCSFQQSLIYWQQPNLPWMSLFPRINAERSFTGRSAPWAQDMALQQSLMSEWSVSLSSLYSLLKSRLCPYFYVCSYQFTVLFRAAGLGGSNGVTALVSPTTRGLREAMKAEGIEFSLPLVEERRKSREQQPGEEELQREKEDCCALQEDEDPQVGDDGDMYEDGGLSWLKEMGVQDQIKKPDSISVQLRREGRVVALDHKPESVVCVAGVHTFTLINFLINCKSVVAAAGSQAGLPPTLLAPVAFRGAAMQTLKARSVNVKTQVGSSYQNISSLEVTGPVLPSSLHAITMLLRSAQKGNFSAALYTHTPTAVMNVCTGPQQGASGSADLSGCGVHPASVQQLQTPSSLGKTALTHVAMNNYNYTWKN